MSFKKSMYNILVDTLVNGDELIFNSYSNCYGLLKNENRDLYYNVENIQEDDIKSEDEKILLKTMLDNGFIVKENFDEINNIKVNNKISKYNMNSPSLSITIAPTMACNMECPYCYEHANNKLMSDEVQDATVKFIQQSLVRINNLRITWYGGEPLLATNVISNISEKIINICQEKKINYTSHIVTNGSLLNLNAVKILKEKCNITSAQITLDGTEKSTNERRKLKNNQNSFPLIVENIKNASKYLDITVRVNTDKTNISAASDFIEFFDRELSIYNNVNYYFAPVTSNTEANKQICNSCYSDIEFSDIYSELLKKAYTYGNERLIHAMYPTSRRIYCGAETINNYVIDPEGYIYKCWMNIGIAKESIGNVMEGLNLKNLNSEHIKWLSADIPSECNSCTSLPICMGGCAYVRLKNKNKPACAYNIYANNDVLKLIYQIFNNKNQNEQKTMNG